MSYFDSWRIVDVGDGTTNSKNPVVDTSRELEFFCRRYGNRESIRTDICEFLDVYIRHLCIGVDGFSNKSCMLQFLCFHNFFFEFLARESRSFFSEFSCFDSWNLDKYIDTIENRTRESRTIFFYRHR